MATYKVLQDIESEDKLLGPLTLRQFVYAALVIVMGFMAFKLAAVSPLFIAPFVLPMAFFALLAAPFGHDQSSEVWLLAKIGFFLKPRRRIWDQSGLQELVTITVPKKVEKHLTDGLTQTEVRSRLQALANTIDSRGWAVKNVNVNLYNQPSYVTSGAVTSDRLIDGTSLPQAVPTTEILASDDILDEANNPTAQHLDAMISQAEQAYRSTLISTVQNGGQPALTPQANDWYMSLPAGQAGPQGGKSDVGSQRPTVTAEDEQELLNKIHKEDARPNPAYGHMKVLDPHGAQSTKQKAKSSKHQSHSPELSETNPQQASDKAAIAQLAARDDLNVATIAREAEKATKKTDGELSGEVTISLR